MHEIKERSCCCDGSKMMMMMMLMLRKILRIEMVLLMLMLLMLLVLVLLRFLMQFVASGFRSKRARFNHAAVHHIPAKPMITKINDYHNDSDNHRIIIATYGRAIFAPSLWR
jgi:hypothetical protein